MLIAVLVGFRHFFLQGRAHPGRELTPPIRSLIMVHGAVMTGWVLTFLIQTILIATRGSGHSQPVFRYRNIGWMCSAHLFGTVGLDAQTARSRPPNLEEVARRSAHETQTSRSRPGGSRGRTTTHQRQRFCVSEWAWGFRWRNTPASRRAAESECQPLPKVF